MQSKIWKCSQDHIHILHNGAKLEFYEISEFINALLMWQDFALAQNMEPDFTAAELWALFNRDARN